MSIAQGQLIAEMRKRIEALEKAVAELQAKRKTLTVPAKDKE